MESHCLFNTGFQFDEKHFKNKAIKFLKILKFRTISFGSI